MRESPPPVAVSVVEGDEIPFPRSLAFEDRAMPTVAELADQFKAKSDALSESDRRIQAGHARTAAAVITKRLPIEPLNRAGLSDSKNPLLKDIYAEVLEYNRLWRPLPNPAASPEIVAMRITRMDFILLTISYYITEKRRHDGHSRPARWNALTTLWKAILDEFDKLGVICLTSPADFRTISDSARSYWLERADKMNRPGFELSNAFNKWLAGIQSGGRRDSFWEWIRLGNTGGTVSGRYAVNYNDRVGDFMYDLEVHVGQGNKLFKCDDSEFDSRGLDSVASGKGWAIWVCSTPIRSTDSGPLSHRMFSHKHVQGKFHHSSFLTGGSVVAAGEWVVDDGMIKAITAKSGHYKPRPQDLKRFVDLFPQIPGDALIRPNLRDVDDADHLVKFYTVSDFRARGLSAAPVRKADFTTKVPSWANKRIAITAGVYLDSLLPP